MLCQWHQTMNSGELQGDPSDSYGVVFDEVLFEWAGVVHCLVSRCVQRWQFVFLTESNLSPSIVCQWFMSKYIQSSQMPWIHIFIENMQFTQSYAHITECSGSTNWILVQISVLWALRLLDPQSFILMIYQCPISF